MSIFAALKLLPPTSPSAADEYAQKQEIIQNNVSQAIAKLNSLYNFTGNCPLEMIGDVHRHHTLFMSSVFRLNNYTLLARMLVWMYRTYHSHGFSYDYFTYALSEWRKAITHTISPANVAEIDGVYQWIIERHPDFLQLAEATDYHVFPYKQTQATDDFVMHLLHGEYQGCLAIGKDYLAAKSLAEFYVEVIEPSMYEVGRLWEIGHISIAQEHLATAVVSRVMLSLFVGAEKRETTSAKAVIAAAPNELHEVGARMVADLLEHQGWEVDYLGANVPKEYLLQYLIENQPCFLGLSIAMPYNLAAAQEAIKEIRSACICGIKIMAGGAAFKHSEDLWRQIGVDAYAVDGNAAIEIARKWKEAKPIR